MPEIGPMELLVIGAVALIVFGPEKLPELARKAGQFIADLRRMASEVRDEFDNDEDDDDTFDPEDEKTTPASEADAAEERAAVTSSSDQAQVEMPRVHKRTRRAEPDETSS